MDRRRFLLTPLTTTLAGAFRAAGARVGCHWAPVAAAVRLTIAIPLLVTGCAVSNVAQDYGPDPRDPGGVAVVSLTRSGIGAQFNLFVNVRGIDRRYDTKVVITDLLTPSDWSCPVLGTIPDDKPCGRLAVVQLPPGEYEFYSWHGTTGSANISAGRPFSKKFTVVAGSVIYLGNVHLAIGSSGFSLRGGYQVNTADMRDRDLTLLHRKYPKIAPDAVLVRILE